MNVLQLNGQVFIMRSHETLSTYILKSRDGDAPRLRRLQDPKKFQLLIKK